MRRLLLLGLLLPAACGGGGGGEKRETDLDRAERLITGWSDALRGSDVEKATDFFTVPLVVSQGRSARLTTRARVRLFNAGLPCGSKVTAVERQEGYFVASFVLTERPGQRCDGPGNPAQVAFKLSGDWIREWRQLVEQAPPPDLEAS